MNSAGSWALCIISQLLWPRYGIVFAYPETKCYDATGAIVAGKILESPQQTRSRSTVSIFSLRSSAALFLSWPLDFTRKGHPSTRYYATSDVCFHQLIFFFLVSIDPAIV